MGELPGSGAMVVVSGLRKVYESESAEPIHACNGIDLEVRRGAVVAVAGPSGSGKSTLLHLIGALDVPDSGTITVDGCEITGLRKRKLAEYRRRVGFVFQRFHLLPTLTALDNVTAPVLPYRTDFDKRARARELLRAVGLDDRADAVPSRLSGGQQQRVAIARALINDPPLVLADEPTGNLDSRTGEEIVELLFQLRERRGTTLMIASHDRQVAERCDRILRIRDGVIVANEPAPAQARP